MSEWLFRRLIQALFVMLAMTMIVFVAVNVIGNPVDILVPPDADQIERRRIIVALGLDQPLWVQYAQFLKGALHGDVGVSYVYNEPALRVILQRLPATLELAVCALVMAVIFGIPLGLYAGLKPDGFLSRLIMTGSILGFSLPTFWVGLVLIMVFAVQLGWLPSGGRGETAPLFGVQLSFLTRDGLAHLLLPAINLSLFKISLVLRLTRAGVMEVLPLDYIKFARAKGLSETRVSVIAFSVVTETIFSWPGMGKLIIDSINVLDRPIIVAYLMLIVALFVTINLIVDFIYTLLDPRVRVSGQEA